MRLLESKLNLKNFLYFHGSRNAGKLSQLDAPTPDNIFFVTSDIDYAMEFAKFNTKSDARNIYVVTLNEEKLNVFDVWKDDISSNLNKKWSYDTFMLMSYGTTTYRNDPKDVFEVFIDIARHYGIMKKLDFDKQKIFEKYYDMCHGYDDMYEKVKQFLDAVDTIRHRKEAAQILDEYDGSKQNSGFEVGKKLRSLFCKDLLEEGYNAFSTEELTHGHRSDLCYGLFDKSALETLVITPIDESIAKKAISKLANKGIDDDWIFHDENQRNYSESNAVIHTFIKTYKELKNETTVA